MRWIISDGDICNAAMRWSNLPDGEVFTCVENIEGKAVVDGCLGDYFRKYGLLDKTPLTLEINDGRVARIECANKNLLHDIQNYIKQDKNADRIGEFALGTNIGLKKLIGNLLQDEKFPGVHIAIGSGYPKDTGAKWDSKAHCDCVMRETTVFVDGRKIMEKGKYLAIE
jgi:leucyl aminopeptidase (aminopeptidase T)